MAVDPDYSLQDLLRCNLCETKVSPLHYKTCHKQLCEVCYGKYFLNESKEREVEEHAYNIIGEIENSVNPIYFTNYDEYAPRRSFRTTQNSGCPNTFFDYRGVANKDSDVFRSVSCLNDEIWICGENNILKLYNPQEERVIESIPTKSGNWPMDIMVTWNGDLVYTDYLDRTVNLVNDRDDIEPVITQQGWKPHSVSASSIGGLLIIMDSDDYNRAKVIHFCGYKVIQSIQFDADGYPLYSSGSIKYISENRNLDICVSDCVAGAIVVVNQTGKFRFRYKGLYSEDSCRPFKPFGITTDRQGWILTSDWYNHNIHILDRDGQLLGYIDCGFIDPYGVCVDTRDNLFVAGYFEGKVRKFRYTCICKQIM